MGDSSIFSVGIIETFLGRVDALQPRPTFEARKALIRLTKSKIWSLIEKVAKSLSEGFRSPRRNELRYAQYNQRLNCCTLRYCSLIEKNPKIFFEEEKQRKLSRAVVLTIANRFELASTMAPAESCLSTNRLSIDFYVGTRSEVS